MRGNVTQILTRVYNKLLWGILLCTHYWENARYGEGQNICWWLKVFILVARILRFFLTSLESWFSDCKQGTSLDDVDINLVLNGTTTKLLFKLVAYISLVLKVAFWLAWQLLVTFGHTKETGREVIKALLPRWHRKISTLTTFSYIFLLLHSLLFS